MDADEIEDYKNYIYAHGDPKKWKWSSPDKAGTAEQVDPGQKIIAFARSQGQRLEMSMTKAKEYARVTGREMVYQDADLTVYNDSGEVIKFNPTTMVLVPLRLKNG